MTTLTLVADRTCKDVKSAEPHYLYVMPDADNPTEMKVGISADVVCRAKQLPDNINFNEARAYQFPSRALAAGAEATLHALLSARGLHRPKAHRKQGWTEWFDAAGMRIVSDYLTSNQALLGWTGPFSMQREVPWMERCVGEAELAFQYAGILVKKALLRGAISRKNGLVSMTLYVDLSRLTRQDRALWSSNMPGYYTRKGNTSLREADVLGCYERKDLDSGIDFLHVSYLEQPLAHPGAEGQVVKAREELRALLGTLPEITPDLEAKVEGTLAAMVAKEKAVA